MVLPQGMFSDGSRQPCDSVLSVLTFGLEPETLLIVLLLKAFSESVILANAQEFYQENDL